MAEAKRLRRKRPKGGQRSYRQIATELFQGGYCKPSAPGSRDGARARPGQPHRHARGASAGEPSCSRLGIEVSELGVTAARNRPYFSRASRAAARSAKPGVHAASCEFEAERAGVERETELEIGHRNRRVIDPPERTRRCRSPCPAAVGELRQFKRMAVGVAKLVRDHRPLLGGSRTGPPREMGVNGTRERRSNAAAASDTAIAKCWNQGSFAACASG